MCMNVPCKPSFAEFVVGELVVVNERAFSVVACLLAVFVAAVGAVLCGVVEKVGDG